MIPGFKCEKGCFECCMPPPLTDDDIDKISQAGHSDFFFIDNFGSKFMKEDKGWCMFLKNGRCSIYSVRPFICADYPTILKNGSCKPEKLASDEFFFKK